MKKLFKVLLVGIMSIGLIGCDSKSFESAKDIFDSFAKDKEVVEFIEDHKVYTQDDDPNELMGKDNAYTSKISWSDKRVEKSEDDKYNGGTIEYFKNEKDAELRKGYLDYCFGKMKESFSEEKYGMYADIFQTFNKTIKQKGNALIAINSSLSDDEIDTYFKMFELSLEDYEFEQKEVPSQEKMDSIIEAKKKEFDDQILEMQNTWNEGMTAEADKFEVLVAGVEVSLNETDLSTINKDVEDFNFPLFKDKYDAWVARLKNVETTISNNKLAAEKQAQAEKRAEIGRQNALKKAGSYLRSSAFSYKSLIDQLEYEGFTLEQSTYAADNCGADWNEQAAKKAKSYLRSGSFSRKSLIDQLIYEKFSREQAEFGANSVGY